MHFTNTTDYASRIVCYLAIKKRRVTMAKLASELKVPESYISKITKQLKNWEKLKKLVKYIIKVFLYLILAVMTLIRWLFINSDDVGKYFALLFINYIYSDRCFELWICIGIYKRMWSNDSNWDEIWCNTRLYPIFCKKVRDIG